MAGMAVVWWSWLQVDPLIEWMTGRETLAFYASLKQPLAHKPQLQRTVDALIDRVRRRRTASQATGCRQAAGHVRGGCDKLNTRPWLLLGVCCLVVSCLV